MRDLLDDIERWQAAGRRVALARVVGTEGSSPREAGAAMAVSDDGRVAGSVSGGCVEGAVVEAALELLAGSRPGGVISFGYSDEEAFAVGLTCGGTIHLFLEALAPPAGDPGRGADEDVVGLLRDDLRARRPVALATVVAGEGLGRHRLVRPGDPPEATGSLGDAELDRAVTRDAAEALEAGTVFTRHYARRGSSAADVFVETFVEPPHLVIFGAVDFSAALGRLGKLLGYHVTVCDARPAFANPQRFPMADDVVNDWPDRLLARLGPALGPRDAVCVLTHDPKFDVPAIVSASRTRVGYLGAMGSRRTHAARVELLREAGLSEKEIGRVMAPIGLDIGARTPEEMAVAVLAEIIAARRGRAATSLRDTAGPIH